MRESGFAAAGTNMYFRRRPVYTVSAGGWPCADIFLPCHKDFGERADQAEAAQLSRMNHHILDKNKRYAMKLGLMGKMLLFILVPVMIGLGALSWFSYNSASTILRQKIVSDSTLMVSAQAVQMGNIVKLLQEVTSNTARIARILRFLKAGTPEEAQENLPAAQKALDDLKTDFSVFAHVGLTDAAGRVVAHTNPKLLGANMSDREYWKQSMAGKPGTQAVVSRSAGKSAFIMSAPVLDKGKVVGVLYTTLNLEEISTKNVDSIRIGQKGYGMVYSGEGLLLLHPNKQYIGDDHRELDWVRQMTQQRNGSLHYRWKGQEKEAFFTEIPHTDWLMVLALDSEEMLSPVSALIRGSILIFAVCAVAVAVIILLFSRNVSTAIRDSAAFAEHMAGGHLDTPQEMSAALDKDGLRSDEVGRLVRNMTIMRENLRKLFDESTQKTAEAAAATEEARAATARAEDAARRAESAKREGMLAAAGQLETVAGVVASRSAELSSAIEQSDHSSAEAARHMAEAATAMGEMNATVREVASNASAASSVSAETRAKAEEGEKILLDSLESVGQAYQVSLELKKDMGTLNEHTQAIGRIMNVISDIADQTNLLALNAAIEAARAGEAGRGFAVVADEVRKLAEKTMASTNEVSQAISAIQESAGQSASKMEEALAAVEKATGFTEQSRESLRSIVAYAENTADQVRAIATASEEQSAASEEINRTIVTVNDMSSQIAEAMRSAAESVQGLSAQAQNLSGLIDEMKRA